ncbi:hypothetical protein LY90DRAFT_704144 [Neocallimastix californiae]|uniref:Uncharacterized protein n=1 Tax=Neocallimastix californiae TaxID=1754190 RepID=A0A1Y2C069_9FUNG|nr:hypothetical protein LY90DRAFT_704144 [Neocallimastix californiae]|eukprot:ORY40314.1 hypothetical protein LY90DRAFT_704144 [Neocallimastix californiae]
MVSSSPIQMDNFETVEYKYDGHNDIDVTRQSANPKGVKLDKADLFKEINVSDLEINNKDIDITRQSANPKGVKSDKADLFKEINVSDLEINNKDIDITRQSANPNKKPFENMNPFEGF